MKKILFALVVFVLSFVIFHKVIGNVITVAKVDGNSMLPTYTNNNIVLVNHLKTVKSNDVVVFYAPDTHWITIKRVTEIRNNGFFVMGDNRHDSVDSRYFGVVPVTNMIGVVIK